MDQKKIFSQKPASEDFAVAFTGYGTYCSVTCGFCGREHFVDIDGEGGDYNEGEYERLLEKHHKDPDNCILYSHCVSYGNLNGNQYVPECPCNAGYNYEKFILDHGYCIATYLAAVATQKQEDADAALEIARLAATEVKKGISMTYHPRYATWSFHCDSCIEAGAESKITQSLEDPEVVIESMRGRKHIVVRCKTCGAKDGFYLPLQFSESIG